MQTKITYITRDGQQHQCLTSAESHSLTNAAAELRQLIETACPKFDGARGISNAVIYLVSKHSKDARTNKPLQSLRTMLAWVEDSFPPSDVTTE